jgi:hypothetical protein
MFGIMSIPQHKSNITWGESLLLKILGITNNTNFNTISLNSTLMQCSTIGLVLTSLCYKAKLALNRDLRRLKIYFTSNHYHIQEMHKSFL